MSRVKVLLVSTWNTACGIAEHAAYLKESVEATDSEIQVDVLAEALNPGWIAFQCERADFPIIHLNYQAALHSRWTPTEIKQYRSRGHRVVVTFHDTGVPNSDLCKAIVDAADVTIVHEPAEDLPAEKIRYWRMGVPGWSYPHVFDMSIRTKPTHDQWCGCRPILGTIGFPFPWKNYDELARVTAAAGWALLLIAPNATIEQQVRWHELNPYIHVIPEFVPRNRAISLLAGCDATAFCYVCHNTGQSGAILQGIAARKPVIALSTCRQFRALLQDDLGAEAIRWATTFDDVAWHLRHTTIARVDPATVALAEQDSWTRLGHKYAALYHEVLA